MRLLGIETTTSLNSIGIISGENILAEMSFSCGDRLSKRLMPAIDDLLGKSSLQVKDIQGVGVTRGPGFFTGVRMGLSVAKGLALGVGIPAVGLSTLEVLAHNIYAHSSYQVCSVLLSRKGEIYTALYKPDSRGGLARIKDECCCSLEELLAQIDSPTIFLGEGALKYKQEIERSKGKVAYFPPLSLNSPRAATVAFLARKRILEGLSSSNTDLTPVYLRGPQIGKAR